MFTHHTCTYMYIVLVVLSLVRIFFNFLYQLLKSCFVLQRVLYLHCVCVNHSLYCAGLVGCYPCTHQQMRWVSLKFVGTIDMKLSYLDLTQFAHLLNDTSSTHQLLVAAQPSTSEKQMKWEESRLSDYQGRKRKHTNHGARSTKKRRHNRPHYSS